MTKTSLSRLVINMDYTHLIVIFSLSTLCPGLNITDYVQKYCENNGDCVHPSLCCSITPALGKRSTANQKRQFYPNGNLDKDFNVHYCLPYKDTTAQWCDLRLQYHPSKENYYGLCPCGPGLRCTPTHDLDPHSYPRDRYGKCTPAT